jgi:hypothetical protein
LTVDPSADLVAENDETVILSVAAGAGYSADAPSSATGTIANDDIAGVTLATTGALVTTEAGGTARFTVRLLSQPASNVTIGLTSSDTTEGTVAPNIVFTTANWNVWRTVTVTGVNDSIADGNIIYSIITANSTSADSFYNGLNVPDVAVTNQDNDSAVSLALAAPTVVAEGAGVPLTYNITRSGIVSAAQTVNFTVSGSATFGSDYSQTGAAGFSATGGSVTFAAGATTAQIRLTPLSDVTVEGDESVTLTLAAGLNYEIVTPVGQTGTISDVMLRILDDGDADFSSTNMTLFANQGYQADVRYAAATTPNATASWTFNGVAAGVYRVLATWSWDNARATNAPFTILDGATPLETVLVNQKVAPVQTDRTAFAGGFNFYFQELGYYPITNGSATVQLTNANANGYVLADAVMLEAVTYPEIRVTMDGANVADGSGIGFGNVPLDDVATRVLTVTNVGTGTLTLGALTAPAGFALSAPGTTSLVGYGASTTITVSLDTSAVGAKSGAASMVNNDGNENPFDISLSATVIASPIFFLDDSQPSVYTQSAGWTSSSGGYLNTLKYATGSSPLKTAEWSLNYLTNGVYRVSATWVQSSNRATNAPYSVIDGPSSTGTLLGTTPLNQELAPNDIPSTHPTAAGRNWEHVGMFMITTGTLTVRLTSAANEYVIADGIRLERLSPLMAEPTGVSSLSSSTDERSYIPASNRGASLAPLTSAQVAPLLVSAASHWSLTNPEVFSLLPTIDVRIAPLPNQVLGLASEPTRTLWLSPTAAGHGWHTGLEPLSSHTTRMDLLSVVTHELGHLLGYDDLDAAAHPNSTMTETIPTATRRATANASPSPFADWTTTNTQPLLTKLGTVDSPSRSLDTALSRYPLNATLLPSRRAERLAQLTAKQRPASSPAKSLERTPSRANSQPYTLAADSVFADWN